MEDRVGAGGGYRRRVLAALVLVARECVERNLRDDGGAGDDFGAAFEFAVDGDRRTEAAFQRFGSGNFCETHLVYHGRDHARLARGHPHDRAGTWRRSREILQKSPAADYWLEAGGQNRRRRNGDKGSRT